MKTKRWFYGNNYEDFEVLYETERYILVQNVNTKKFTFGLREDFGTFFGFPVVQSCLNRNECIETLERFIKINNKYKIETGVDNSSMYNEMIKVLESRF